MVRDIIENSKKGLLTSAHLQNINCINYLISFCFHKYETQMKIYLSFKNTEFKSNSIL